jgi:hypothetical protein
LEEDSVRLLIVGGFVVELFDDIEEDDDSVEEDEEVGVELSSFPVLKKSCKLLI